jgi:hypothetical protein
MNKSNNRSKVGLDYLSCIARLLGVQILCTLLFWHISFCQVSFHRSEIYKSNSFILDSFVYTNNIHKSISTVQPDIFIDTLQVWGDGYRITHFHIVSNEIEKRLQFDSTDEIFNNNLNKHSRLIFEGRDNYKFSVPTIPLTHIIFLKHIGIIIGLSKIEVSPYHIVIYSSDGKLLCKRTLQNLELKLEKREIEQLLKAHHELANCLAENVIVKEDDSYFIEMTRKLFQIIRKDTFLMKKVSLSSYFPYMSTSFDSRLYSKYHFSFSDSDPLYDIIMIGSVPYLLVLNSEDGKKVNIPLVTTVKLLSEFLEKK